MLLETEAELSEAGERHLIEKIAAGHEASFETFVRLYQKRLRAFAHSYAAEVNEHPDDIAQDILLQVYLSAERFENQSKVSTWVFSIARNVIRNQMRKKKLLYFWKSASEPDEADSIPAFNNERIRDAEQTVSDRQNRSMIQQAVRALPKKSREAFSLYEFSELSYDEIASILNISIGTVKSRIHNAKRHLKDFMTAKGFYYDEL